MASRAFGAFGEIGELSYCVRSMRDGGQGPLRGFLFFLHFHVLFLLFTSYLLTVWTAAAVEMQAAAGNWPIPANPKQWK